MSFESSQTTSAGHSIKIKKVSQWVSGINLFVVSSIPILDRWGEDRLMLNCDRVRYIQWKVRLFYTKRYNYFRYQQPRFLEWCNIEVLLGNYDRVRYIKWKPKLCNSKTV